MTKPILILGEAWGNHERQTGQSFSGPAGGFLRSQLSAVGIDSRDCYFTSVFPFQPDGGKILSLCSTKPNAVPGYPAAIKTNYISKEYAPYLKDLYTTIREVNPNVILALGGLATWAILKNAKIKSVRGAPVIGVTGHKVLPSYNPGAVFRDYKLRPIVFSDIKKLKREMIFPEVRRPRRELWIEPTLSDLADFEPYILATNELSVDIETKNLQMTCIGFAPTPDRAIVIPFIINDRAKQNSYWPSLNTELAALAYVRKWLALPNTVFGQNFVYDLDYLWTKYGITSPNFGHDTMLTHHAMQPEMEKGLGFLASLYTNEPSWKFMLKSRTIKKDS